MKSRASLGIVYLTVFIDLLGFGIILPLLPRYAEVLGASGLELGILLTAYSAAQLFGAALLGRLSDRFGRRPLLLLSLFGSAVSLAASGVAGTLVTLALARALAGLFGGSIATAQAYIADVTAPEERARYMGLLGASIGMGFVVGPALGAALTPFGFGGAAFTAAGLAAANLLFALFKLKESRTAASGAAPRSVTLVRLAAALSQPRLARLLAATFLTVFAFVAMETTLFFLGERRFGLTQRGFGGILVYVGVIVIIVQGGLIGPLTKRFGERRVAIVGGVLMGLALAAIPLGPSLAAVLAAMGGLAVAQALCSPTLSTLLSRASGADEQGGVLGVGQSFSALARAVGPVVAGWLYDRGAGLPYYLAAALALAAALSVAGVHLPAEGAAGAAVVAPD